MRTGRADAEAVLRTWVEDRALLRCELSFGMCAAAFRARAVSFDGDVFRLQADDEWAELALSIGPSVEFGYGDLRDFPREGETFVRIVIVFLPYEGEPADADQIVLAELVEPTIPEQ